MLRRPIRALGLLALLLTGAFACAAPPTIADAGADTHGMDAIADSGPPAPSCDASFAPEPGDPNGHPQPLLAATGEVRAGRLAAADLPVDRTGLATWAARDFVLANHRVAFMIEDVGASDLYDPWGGTLVGIAAIRDGHLVDAADFEEATFGIGRHGVETTSVSVVRNGSSGGPAVIRAIGMLRPIPFIDQFGRGLAPDAYTDIRVSVDYELQPDSDVLDTFVTFDVLRADPVSVRLMLHAFFQRYRMPLFTNPTGFRAGDTAMPFVGYVDDTAMSYAWMSPDSDLAPFLSESGFDGYRSASFVLPACARTRRRLVRVVAGGPGLDGLQQALARSRNESLREIRGTVTEADGSPAIGVRVHASNAAADRYFTRASTDATGAFVLHVPQSEDARLVTWRAGNAVAGPVMVPASTASATLMLAATGTVQVTAVESGTNRPLPVRVQVIPLDGAAPQLPAMFGEPGPRGGRLHLAFPADGRVSLRTPPGRYRVVVSHGYEYEISDTEIVVSPDATTMVSASLRHSVDTTGVLCGDFHIHTHRSADADDDVRTKIRLGIADGVEVLVRSDHEFVADFESIIQELNVGAWAFGVPSIELTTFTWGHFGVVPLPANAAVPNGGAVLWANRLPPDVFREVRAAATNPTIIINHPRGGTPRGNYFDAAGYDPVTGTASRPEYWDEHFTVVEVFNETDFDSARNGVVRDWLGLLDHGRRVFATGSSDSHNGLYSNPVGYPRTCLITGTDNPRELTAERVRELVAGGHSTISGGIYLSAEAPGSVSPGREARGVGAMANVRVTVQAATWIAVNRIEVIVDGRTTQTLPVTPDMADPGNPVVRYRGDIAVPVAERGSYVIFVAAGPGDLAPTHPRYKPFGVTNPIFLQR